MAVTVGIDIGTTSVKAVAADDDGTVLRRVRIPHEVRSPTADTLEHDATVAWVDGVLSAWQQLSDGIDVAGIEVGAMVPSLAPVDAGGRPIGPGLLYGDHRGTSEGSPSGRNPAENSEFVNFVRWAAANHPEAAAYWPAQAVANAALCGRGAIDGSTAMTTLPLFTGPGWDEGLCASLGIDPEQLPDLALERVPVGDRGGVPVGGGTIDAVGEQLVAGADSPGDVLVICGTTLITWACTEGWPDADGLWTVPHTTPGLAMIGGPSNAGGLFLQRVRTITGDPALDAVAPDQVPIWLPYIRGERTPLHDPHRRAVLADVDLTHGPAEVLAAGYESAGFVVRHHLDIAGVAVNRIVASGGGTHVEAWMQALADCTGLPVDVAAVPEGAALGAAYLARVTAGVESDVSGASRWARTGRRVEPRPSWVEACDRRYRRFRSLVDQQAEDPRR